MGHPREARQQARNFLASNSRSMSHDQIKRLVEQLKQLKEFGLARKLLDHYRHPPIPNTDNARWAREQQALCTYKDEELQSEKALDQAYSLLSEGKDLSGETFSETLSLAGAIFKRRWEISGQRGDLEHSIDYYERAVAAGYQSGQVGEWSYAAINAAFVLERLADATLQIVPRPISDIQSPLASDVQENTRKWLDRAADYRRKVIEAKDDLLSQSPKAWWGHATLVEAFTGLGRYPEAITTLQQALATIRPPDWELESTARQLAALVLLHRERPEQTEWDADKALEVLKCLVPPAVAHGMTVGKVGLALSGGGFRAALYHIGVLACLAEYDLLRWVEVISCVSGGAIVGAHYYLELRQALNSRPNLEREDYMAMVDRIIQRFDQALKYNIRTRALGRMLNWSWSGNLTERLGRMYEQYLYVPAADGRFTSPIPMNELLVTPCGHDPENPFHPRRHNWNRSDKVPVLIINATTLNTGHNWQFTASWMGEAPACTEERVDATGRLRRFYYSDNPSDQYRHYPLGTAVAASSCVPFPFPPIALEKLYPRQTVRLVDGGVDDNQGIFGLLEQNCNVLMVSDGSGQLSSRAKPCPFVAKVAMRSNDIMMQSLRRGLFRLLDIHLRSGRVRDILYIHMKKDIEEPDVTRIDGDQDCSGPPSTKSSGTPPLDREVQTALAATRTDLDNFSKVERDSLMYAGYVLTKRELDTISASPLRSLANLGLKEHNWPFLQVKELATGQSKGAARVAYLRELHLTRHQFTRWLRRCWSIR
ncbi:MAG: patatin-like phospholipase family protein [Magnetococcales bacterium]|nr:patatin-like phospholipase family protein [Magnetococcales bacterium]